ncbi:hypothetical protein C7445_102174 [Alicyclobacillus sacchari]|uniref:Uncharacterized protein n=1 Tax=Alicyclobacillus sacchari TaxID=392010 RepID=A0A4R8LUW8_9BACL|nr:hypothetical protein C7445_102174 [Alicyclobacillus sacchari]GMA55575.1 hypothetical protein GCM10025858_00780 [Alicyclobacillus sacchari]GMA59181.1 hypothetical protein GCM10025858_36840 [Alicyclobacillus sacchari]
MVMKKERFASDPNLPNVISGLRPIGGTLEGTMEVEVSLHVRTYGVVSIRI